MIFFGCHRKEPDRMNRLHVSLFVPDIHEGIRYYSALFGAEPSKVEAAYAQWILDDPSVNFVIEESETNIGLNHLGIQTSSETELARLYDRFDATGGEVSGRGTTQCCFAVSDKGWARDPAGIAWEGFLTHRRVTDYGNPGDFTARAVNEARGASEESGKGCC
jgi:catechol 2,3-dioxygenase-like lactoylglutathione lyase family enzyme